MKTKISLIITLILTIILAACAAEPETVYVTEIVEKEVVVEGETIVVEVVEVKGETVIVTEIVEVEVHVEGEPISVTRATPIPLSGYNLDDTNQPETDEDLPKYLDGYISTAVDHLSTFGIDVDTASYTMARNFIQDEKFPPSDSIRVEEFVNYFDMGYPAPQNSAFGILGDAAPSPFNSDEAYILRIGVQGYEVSDEERKPVALTFVIDTSGSMGDWGKLELVKESLEMLVDELRPGDTVSIVTFGTEAKVVLKPTDIVDSWYILKELDYLRASGSTNAEDGLRKGYQLAIENFDARMNNRVILCSDGVANVGQTQANELLEFIRGYANAGITLTTMGFGMGTFNDPFMEDLADKGDGSYAYIDDIDEAERLFVDELVSTLQVIALDAKIQVDFNPEVVALYHLMGYENRAVADEDFRDDSVDAGEIGAGHSVTALYKLILHPEAEGRIATVQLRWENPDSHKVEEVAGDFFTWDLLDDFENAAPHYQLAVIAAHFAEILRENQSSPGLHIQDLLPYTSILTEELAENEDVIEFVSLLFDTYSLLK